MVEQGIHPDKMTYNSLILGHLREGKLSKVEDLVSDMKIKGLNPKADTYSILVKGYCELNNFGEAYIWYREMFENGFHPSLSICNELTTSLKQVGRLKEAQIISSEMSIKGMDAHIINEDMPAGPVILGLLHFGAFSRFQEQIDFLVIIIGSILVAVGRAGLMPFVRRFTAEQFEAHEADKRNIKVERVKAREEMWWRFAWVAGSLVAIPLFKSEWQVRLIITGGVMGITCVLFYLATPLYHKKDQVAATSTRIAEKPFTCIRVVRAALLKLHMEYPPSPVHFFCYNNINDENDQLELWPQVKLLRWIDKAAIIESESTLGHEEQEKAGRLCSVTEVQETKYILKLIPMWSTFLVFGLLLSAGNTFSAQQGIETESPDLLIYLVLLQSITRETVSTLSRFLLSKWFPKARLKQNMMRIWAGMLVSILCSVVLWQVEKHRRLDIDKSDYRFYEYSLMIDKSDYRFYEYSSMSIWWLAPQFLLLGLMDGLAMYGLEGFTIDDDHLSGSMKNFLPAINTFVVTGIGNTLNIIFVFSSNKTLFQNRLNNSRLDHYYKYLTIYGTPINCVYLLLISIFVYRLSDAAQVNEESMSKATVPDGYTTKRATWGDIFLCDRY
ncbi:hypothetical protein LWI29_035706 [Acer saccharum]|uniref:Uncharacterized protein n=1 Tax=Acer saccharum TaxID=4024 RepID=A0AA39VPH2_ACESA|nr:hypothetical protein LWI29_035706 [Acer saccharum]